VAVWEPVATKDMNTTKVVAASALDAGLPAPIKIGTWDL